MKRSSEQNKIHTGINQTTQTFNKINFSKCKYKSFTNFHGLYPFADDVNKVNGM